MRRKRINACGIHAGSRLRAARRCAVLVLGTLVVIVVQAPLQVLRLPLARRLPMRWHRLYCMAIGLDLRRVGAPETRGPVLYVANHASYLDILAVGSQVEGSFVAKAEVRRWPVIGLLCRLQKTVFVDRRVVSAGVHLTALQRRLAAGDNMILFPEGTTSDGNRVLPFKGSLFRAAAAESGGRPVRVQPVTVVYSRFGGLPMGRNLRPFFAWYGDMTLLRHLWTCFGMGRPGVDVVFHPSVTLDEFGSHADLARHCQAQIARSLSDALAGRQAGAETPDGAAAGATEFETAPVFSL